jgi:hypothetical protein
MYGSEQRKTLERRFGGRVDRTSAAEVFAEHVLGAAGDNLLELTPRERRRIFNLGYFTWVEQQGLPIDEFTARRDHSYWRGLRSRLPQWDEMIDAFNREAGVKTATA